MNRTDELRSRLLGYRPTDRFWGWALPIAVAVVGGFLRFWQLGRPHQLVFDETYYVKQGVSLLLHGVELRVPDTLKKPDELFTAGTPDVFGTQGDMVVHPSVGKWVIAVGEQVFGMSSGFGWRFSVALLGTLMILMVGRAARRMFGSTLLGTVAAFLLAFEGHHFVHSRTGLLDLIVGFFALAAFCCLLIDRDRSREILARAVGALPPAARLDHGPWLGLRPWRWAAGICLGLAAGTKWSGVFFLVAFGLMTVLWDLGARRAVGVRHWVSGTMLKDAPFAALAMVGTAVVTYLASWTGWFLTDNGYDRQWAADHPGEGPQWLPEALRSLWKYHQDVYGFHIGLSSPHPYQTNPWSWLIQGRPTSFFYEGPKRGDEGCVVDQCSKAITSIGQPSLWWVGTAAVVVCLGWWVLRRDWRAGAVLAGLAGGYLPWFRLQERTIYSFYTVAFEPWVILGIVFVIGLVIGPRVATGAMDGFAARTASGATSLLWVRPRTAQALRLGLVAAYLLVVLWQFCFFWPVYTAQVIPQTEWSKRMWFPSWI